MSEGNIVDHEIVFSIERKDHDFLYIRESEVGYGENKIKHQEKYEQRFERDKKEVCTIIHQKMEALLRRFKGHADTKSCNVEKLRTLCLLRLDSFGTRNSLSQLKYNAPDSIEASLIHPEGMNSKNTQLKKSNNYLVQD